MLRFSDLMRLQKIKDRFGENSQWPSHVLQVLWDADMEKAGGGAYV